MSGFSLFAIINMKFKTYIIEPLVWISHKLTWGRIIKNLFSKRNKWMKNEIFTNKVMI